MELWQEILSYLLTEERVKIYFPQMKRIERVFEKTCYKALCEIKEVLKNPALTDTDCFNRIEEIVCIFENIGCSCGSRHDF
ncbi:MAG: hypothetical protein IJV96_01140 [Clostridia bacterium]|nr:hypothetical protein [Clostridia bacterium]